MTERDKQIQAVDKCIETFVSSTGSMQQLKQQCADQILDALAPWLTVKQETMIEVNNHVLKTMARVADHGVRIGDIERRLDEGRLNLDQLFKANQTLIDRISRVEKRLQGFEPLPKPEPPTAADRYSVSIMRAKGSKWHTVVNDIDWVAAIEYADRWYGDPEVQQVRVENEREPAMEPVFLKRKP